MTHNSSDSYMKTSLWIFSQMLSADGKYEFVFNKSHLRSNQWNLWEIRSSKLKSLCQIKSLIRNCSELVYTFFDLFFTIIFACETVTFLLITRVKYLSSVLPARNTSHLPAEPTRSIVWPKHHILEVYEFFI